VGFSVDHSSTLNNTINLGQSVGGQKPNEGAKTWSRGGKKAERDGCHTNVTWAYARKSMGRKGGWEGESGKNRTPSGGGAGGGEEKRTYSYRKCASHFAFKREKLFDAAYG